jgi:NADH-quinone oxidoreductase subunit H
MSEQLTEIIAALVKSIIVIAALLAIFAELTLIERRVLARFQMRLGPNRLGPFGLVQPIADGLKMAFKEQIIPTQAKVVVYLMAPMLSIFVALSAFAVVPLGDSLGIGGLDPVWKPVIADVNVGIFYILAISSLAVYGIVLGGWSSGNHYSLLGALRSAAQMVSYEVSVALSLAGILMFAGSLSMVEIVHQQMGQGIWFILAQPLAFILYSISALAETNRPPFDLPEAEQELTAGYLTEFSGLRWSIYQMSEYVNMITVSSVLVTLFCGGWTLFGLERIPLMSIVIYSAKVAFFLFLFMWARATLPRIRYDQLMRLGWMVLLPLAVVNLIITAATVVFGWSWIVSGLFGLVVLVVVGALIASRRWTITERSITTVGIAIPSTVHLVKIEPEKS